MSSAPSVSLEFFPPRSQEMTARLHGSLTRLLPYGPAFCTVSYGAGGSTRHGTAEWVRRIRLDYGVDCAPHLAHISHACEEVRAIVGGYLADGVRRVIAVRGDLPQDGVPEEVRGRGYASTVDLVAELKAAGVREIMVGAHPEHGAGDEIAIRRHVEFLQKKMDAGADLVITQFFLDNTRFNRLRDAYSAAGIDHRLAPGIMPLHNVHQVLSFARKTRVSIPEALRAPLEKAEDDPAALRGIADRFSLNQVRDLACHGVERFHLFTMNRAPLTAAICEALGLAASATPA